MVRKYNLADKNVLEVGSLNVNGSARKFFTGRYFGTDMREGPGVDLVCNAHALMPPLGSLKGPPAGRNYDVVVCTEMLEHDDAPWDSILQMRLVIRDGGILLLTCRGYDERGCFPLHGYPEDLWRYSVQGVEALLRAFDWEPLELLADPQAPGVLAVARAV